MKVEHILRIILSDFRGYFILHLAINKIETGNFQLEVLQVHNKEYADALSTLYVSWQKRDYDHGNGLHFKVAKQHFFLIIKPTRCTNFSNLIFWNKTLHVLDSSSVHHQEFFTLHTVMVCVYSEKLLMMDRGTVQNM